MTRVLSIAEEEMRLVELQAAEEDAADARDREDRVREQVCMRDQEREQRR